MIKKSIVLLLITLFILPCAKSGYDKDIPEFTKNEIDEKIIIINENLGIYEVGNAEVFRVAHNRIGPVEISKSLKQTSCSGISPSLSEPPGQESRWPAPGVTYTPDLNVSGNYSNMDLIANYDTESSVSLHNDYLSFKIIIAKEDDQNIPEIERCLSELILNRQWGDTLTIVSR